MRPPTIHIQEEDGAASALTMRYINGDNEIDLKAVYATVSSLQEHPGREHIDPQGEHIPCSKAFFDSFWSVAASLLDYFADFYTTDTALMQSPGIALIQAHTARARALAATLAEKQGDDRVEALAAFDAIALATPSVPDHAFTYPSLTHPGKTLSYQLKQGAPPVKRHEGLTDPSMLIEKPGFGLLDEAVGSCKGTEAYVPMTGPVGQNGVGFDVWAVVERDALGWGSSAADGRHSALVELLSETFDDWDFGDDEE
ncbi:hypothetical protein E8E13_005428 [Curvularia kusanoi]|uniref:Uncharacterized protein n=1 Tax=Curvularia kusanoi TaxID=90978 RepID=A0A9P4W7R0_CURKU|nr:hypothetical protein E8E13_005428 [Curvularia kusanoi]